MKTKQPFSWARVLVLAMGICAFPAHSFELIELNTDLVVLDQQTPFYSWEFQDQFGSNNGFTLFSEDSVEQDITFGYGPAIGLLPNETLPKGFILLDGTLFLEATPTDPSGGRADVLRTYRLNVDPRLVNGDVRYLRNLYIRQGDQDVRYARERALATTLADARVMRLSESPNGARWVRAVRAIGNEGRADIRYMPRTPPDGVLGHYGYDTRDDGASYYVWAVMDRNSRYSVGVNADNDDDGIYNLDDNCRDTPNPDQQDNDGDGAGNACDDDDDGDGVNDTDDNCPLASNPDQADADGDGMGDLCDIDHDNDGVPDGDDECPFTEEGDLANTEGCSIADLCPCENESGWKNHGAYVRCVAKSSESFLEAGLIDSALKDLIVSEAAQSECGRKD
ncbi:thrombospondin type 3 repeat-containing protein [Marinihelvus fidelis]|nr:thrombospondin type 3 repeat-containing protein [Marinihelvus fidelis]